MDMYVHFEVFIIEYSSPLIYKLGLQVVISFHSDAMHLI